MITDQKAPDCQTKLILHVITMDNVETSVENMNVNIMV